MALLATVSKARSYTVGREPGLSSKELGFDLLASGMALVLGCIVLLKALAPSSQLTTAAQLDIMRRMGLLPDAKSSLQNLRDNRYSIIVSTYDRIEHLLYFLNHYGNSNLPNLDRIVISWGLGQVEPPAELDLMSYRVPVYLEKAQRNSLTERFRVPSSMRTEAALWIDDDIWIEDSAVEFMFRAWQSLGRPNHRIVGLTGREVTKQKQGRLKYTFHQRSYSMILTNNAFMDKTMMKWFWARDQKIRDAIGYVDEHLNCEDILMNYVVSRRNGLPPVLVEVGDDAQTINSRHGISGKPGHTHQRNHCVQRMNDIFGSVLVSSNVAVVKASPDKREFVDMPKAWQPAGEPWGRSKYFVGPA